MSTALALLLSANIAAYPLDAVEHDPRSPAEFLFMYQGPLKARGLSSRAAVRQACGGKSEFGCQYWDGGVCKIFYLKGKPHVYWHEIAHCNGMEHE